MEEKAIPEDWTGLKVQFGVCWSLIVTNIVYILREYLADPGKARGCSTNTSVSYLLNYSLIHPLVPTALQRRHAQTVRDMSYGYKIDYVIVIKNFLTGMYDIMRSVNNIVRYWPF